MFRDIEDISADVVEGFKESKFYFDWSNNNPVFQFRILVLTIGYWPSYPQQPCTIPLEVCFIIIVYLISLTIIIKLLFYFFIIFISLKVCI